MVAKSLGKLLWVTCLEFFVKGGSKDIVHTIQAIYVDAKVIYLFFISEHDSLTLMATYNDDKYFDIFL